MQETQPEDSFNKKRDRGAFLGVAGLAAAFLIPLLQANGVDVNWQVSILLYVAIIGICVWSLLKHAIPHLSKAKRLSSAIVLSSLVGILACYATVKQYQREHPQQAKVMQAPVAVSNSSVAAPAMSKPKSPHKNSRQAGIA